MSTPALTPTPDTPSRHNPTDTLITQLSVGPDLRDVAAVLLRQHLRKLYPTLDLDPTITMVGTPTWLIVNDQVVSGFPTFQALTDILAAQVVHGVPALYIEGEHFLAQQPITEPEIHLPVRIDEIANLINLLAPVMLTAFQEQQLAFWNAPESGSQPRWHELSKTLREVWNIDRVGGWDNDDCEMARSLFRAPDLASRKLNDPYKSNAYLIGIDLVDGEKVTHLNEVSIVVLIGTHKGRTIILAHSLLKGFQKFDSLEKLGATLPEHVSTAEPAQKIQWRLLEPLDSIFDYQACALISIQIDVIGAMDFSLPATANPNKLPSTPTPEVDDSVKKTGPGLDWFKDALPDWLSTASLSDLNNYSRHLKDLAALHSQNEGKSYMDGILPIRQYALSKLNALHSSKLLEHAKVLQEAPELETALESIQLRVKSPVIWGTFTVPGKIDTFNFSVADLALQNLIALPLGDKTLHSTRGKTLPAWLTVKYIEELISQADIGSTYPELIKSELIDNSPEALRRQTLFTQHLRIQLPLQALQCKIREENGIDARGYRYVAAAMEPETDNRVVEGQTIVIRPLTFAPKRRKDGSQDEVANMFVIGPEDSAAGPCLLYRPMLDQPLSQYPSPSNLLYAIQQSASLRDTMLAWLPEDVSSDYANYVFPGTLPSPWTITDFLIDPDKLTTMTGPMGLGGKALEGDLPEALFKANAQALVTLADRQSVSNAENRWASFKQAGWTLFYSVLPFLGRTVGIGAWIWQVMDQLQALHEAHEKEDTQAQWAALTDVLLNLGMAITLHISTRSNIDPRLAKELATTEAPKLPESTEKKISVEQLSKSAPHQVSNLQQGVSISGAANRTPASLATVLDHFKITRPEGLGTANTEEGAYKHLYSLNSKWYAPVGPNWFEVTVDENGTVVIIDAKEPARSGPALAHTLPGQWVVDVRLRLRGGGSTSLTRLAETEGQREATELRTKLTAFEKRKATAQQELQKAHQAMSSATADEVQAKRQLYLQALESQRAEYAAALSNLKSLHVFSPTADYQQKSLGYLKAQLELITAGIGEALTVFTPKLRAVLNQIDRQSEDRHDRQIPAVRQLIELNQDMISRLEQIQERFTELKRLEKEGLRVIQNSRSKLPGYSLDDLKALQVTLARNVCLPENSVATAAEAWLTIDQIVDTADIVVQTLRDTLNERSISRLDERIDSLNDLIEQFSVIDERLLDFKTTFSAQTLEAPVKKLRLQLDEFRQRAERNLVLVLDEREILRSRPALPVQPPRPKKQFIRTRYNGVLIGEPRLSDQGLETNLVDIKSPLTDKVIATFHQKTPGVWVERVNPPKTATAAPNLEISLNKGQSLLDSLAAFNTRMTEYIKQPGRSPGGIEYLFHQYALQMEQTSSDIEKALTSSNATESNNLPAATVNKALTEAAENLYQQATNNMLTMIKQQPPTVPGVEWLNNNNAISVAKTVTRRRLKGGKTLYLDEYSITDRKTRQILWYAHFLYSTSWVPAKSFVYARLKTPHEQGLGMAADSTQGLSGPQRLAHYRSMIGLEQAKRLFFSTT
jgi:hypothetical protein